VDTVGFIQKLPTELVTAFRATLEEVAEADLLLHVLDASRPGSAARLEAVHSTLDDLGVTGAPMVLAVNKIDLCSAEARQRLSMYASERYLGVAQVSASTGAGLSELRQLLSRALSSGWVPAEAVFPYQERTALGLWRRYGVVESEEFTADGIRVTGRIPDRLWEQISPRRPPS
jgi:GTP-binding protein HflX